MHPDVRQDKPGECPICGMTLEAQPIEKDTGEEAAGHHQGEGKGHHHKGGEGHHHTES